MKNNIDLSAVMNRSIPLVALLCALLALPTGIHAQERNEEVTIVAPYQPKILDPAKPAFFPVLPDIDRDTREFEYTILDRKASTRIQVTPVEPRRPAGERRSDQFRNLLKAGFGNYLTPYLFFTANTVPDDEKTLGVKGEVISSFQGIEGYGPGGYAKINLEGYGQRHFRKSTLSAGIKGNYRQFHYYGFRPDSFPDIEVTKKDIRQSLPSVEASIGLKSTYSERRDWMHHVSLDIGFIGDSYDASEFGALLKGGISYHDDLFGLGDKESMGIDLGIDYQLFNDSIDSQKFLRARAFPFYEFVYDQFRLKVGLNTFFASDTASRFHLYPYLRGEVSLIDNRLALYAGIRGQLRKNSFMEHTFINPYITNAPELRNTSEKFEFFGGVRASAGLFELNAEIATISFNDMPFYVTDTNTRLSNQFLVIYDDGQLFSLNAGAGINILRELFLKFRAGVQLYSLDREEEAWHKPPFELSLQTTYKPFEKLTLSGEVFYAAARYAKNFVEGEPVSELDPYLDLNIGAEYKITDNFAVFLSGMNLLNKKYQPWSNYPVQGLQVMGGVILTSKK